MIVIRPLIFVLVAAAMLLPGLAQAQFKFAPGTYELANGAKGTASLKLVLAAGGSPTMVVGVKNGREHKFRSNEITAFTIDGHRFVQAANFRFRSGDDAGFQDPAILEIVETGKVELFYYYYQVTMGPNFLAHVKLHVLRKPGTNTFFAYNPGRSPGFDSKLAPGTFVAALFPADPVLQRKFATNGISLAQLPAAVHAYNQGVRFTP
ncbi:hypothetical protein Q3A66_16820 [Hymenobacter sp. BT770]|uniref:hypothetical protein n=1 Tax=Hymenobacter sp. BT770 TaxID=2886942 RepID=UPI001D1165C8|nr:hypothetical protein [Hymenobacter sp. BT770]MCC3154680.1 hypothetical protein [Hymenobacter sp. BT770]MDO3416734.1 hypothetical protein [Hymenobacter sp. BT770]